MCFFMGKGRDKRRFNANHIDPNPPYIKTYERMWKDCQTRKRIIPFSDPAADLVDNHPLNTRMEAWAQESPMFARWQIIMLRTALLLAVNENQPTVEARHVQAAYRFVSEYLIPCAAIMVDASLTSREDEASSVGSAIVDWAGRYFDKHGVWPEAAFVRNQRFWKKASMVIRNRAEELAIRGRDVVKVQLIDGPWGPGKTRTILVCPTGDYSVYDESHGKKFKYADFYAGRQVR
jgi:hypothetical protein